MLVLNLKFRGRWLNLGLSFFTVLVLALMTVGYAPMSYAPLRYLETRFPFTTSAADMHRFAGMLVLGSVDEERRVAAIDLMQQYPEMKALFTGRGVELLPPSGPKVGQSAVHVLYASTSSNTYEDAMDSAVLPGVDVAQPWLLVTSAWHMPRALATFHKAGWNVAPYPVDYRTGPSIPWSQYSLAKGAVSWRIVLHEFVGFVGYWAAKRI
ncbi:MAG: YdcF family protein [Glaciimonas sp.]|nr:YdcF family protein [Glaciimonas sp.]